MPYLLSKNNSSNLLVDKTGESIYYRHYPIKYNQRAVVIAKSSTNEYAASLDDYNNIHIIYKSSANSLIHLYERNNKFEVVTLLEDFNNTYRISNLTYLYHRKNYLFYCAYNPYEKTSDLIFHPFMQGENSEPQSLFSIPNLTSPYECILGDNVIYLLCQVLNEKGDYELNLYEYSIANSSWGEFETITTSTSPFMGYSICSHNAKIHITYGANHTGVNTIYYTQKTDKWSTPIDICTSTSHLSPIIFIYNNIIWVNWKENNKLMNTLSSNNGHSFTQPKLCSAQSPEAKHYYFYGYKNNSLTGSKFYGFINKHPILAVLSQVDTDNILLSNQSNLEIKSIIDNFTSNEMYNSVELKKQIDHQKEVQKSISDQYDKLANMAKELQAQAKMWKTKYTKAEQDIKKLKKKMRKSYNRTERVVRPIPEGSSADVANKTAPEVGLSATNESIESSNDVIE